MVPYVAGPTAVPLQFCPDAVITDVLRMRAAITASPLF